MEKHLYRWFTLSAAFLIPLLLWWYIARLTLGGGPNYNMCMTFAWMGSVMFVVVALQQIGSGKASSISWTLAWILGGVIPLGYVIFGQQIGGPVTPSQPSTVTPEAAAAASPAATSIPPPAAVVDYRQEWVELMDELIQAEYRTMVSSGLADAFLLEEIAPITSVPVKPGETRWLGQIVDGNNPGHVRLTAAGDSQHVTLCGAVWQTKWESFANRFRADPGNDLLLARNNGLTPVTITAERVLKNGQQHHTDQAMRPAVRKVYRHVPGLSKVVVVEHILTELPSGQRVDSTMTVLLLRSDGTPILPESPTGSLSVCVDATSWKPFQLKFEETTRGKNNPPLVISPNVDGAYDVVVVLTPL